MTTRYYFEGSLSAEQVRLEGDEAHHLSRVMRAKPGDSVTLFDGQGTEGHARIADIGKQYVALQVISRQTVDREAAIGLELAVALPKGDRQRWLVEKAVELGVTTLVPLETERGVAQGDDGARARLRRTVIEASKQCGRNRLLTIAPAQSWRDYARHTEGAIAHWIAHPGGNPLPAAVAASAACGAFRVAIGPEGGFTMQEFALAQEQGWTAVDLGPRILRIETAALLLAARLLNR